jgi:hypothetical protein
MGGGLGFSQSGKGRGIEREGQIPPIFMDLFNSFSKLARGSGGSGAANALNITSGALGRAGNIDLVGNALNTLNTGMDPMGFMPNVLSSVEARLRPLTELSKKTAGADVLESAASLGQTRSSGTVETLGRTFTGLEGQLQNTLGGIEGSLAPIAMQQPLQAAGGALQAILGLIAPGLQESQFKRGLGVQGLTGAVPFESAILDPGKSSSYQADAGKG